MAGGIKIKDKSKKIKVKEEENGRPRDYKTAG
jgi:hypothetical protein